MAAFVPDFDPTKKLKPLQPPPWGADPGNFTLTTTYSQHFAAHPYVARQPIRPTGSFQWAGGGTVFATRSTTQDSYQPQMSKRLPSCKPERVWETTPWQAPLSTTQSASYANYGNVRRTLPVIPKSRDVNVGPFQGRATSFDAFQPIPSGYAVRKPIYPSSEGRPFGGDVAQGPMTTTQSASYVAHNVKPYVPAKKPTQSLSAFGP